MSQNFKNIEKHIFQTLVFILALVPITAGLMGLTQGVLMTGAESFEVSLDSHVRYLSGILFAIGIAFWIIIPNIERKTDVFGTLTFLVFIGGCARAYGIFTLGWPHLGMQFGLFMEIIITPLLCLWQKRIAWKYNARDNKN